MDLIMKDDFKGLQFDGQLGATDEDDVLFAKLVVPTSGGALAMRAPGSTMPSGCASSCRWWAVSICLPGR